MKIEYVYKKEHQDIMDKIEARIKSITDDHEKVMDNYRLKCGDEGIAIGSINYHFTEPSPPHEVKYLQDQLTYLQGCLAPVTIRVIEEEEISV